MPALELINAGGPVTFVTAWLDREANSKDWRKQHTVRQQGDLFDWAQAHAEVSTRKPSSRTERPKANPAPKHRRKRDPA